MSIDRYLDAEFRNTLRQEAIRRTEEVLSKMILIHGNGKPANDAASTRRLAEEIVDTIRGVFA